MLYIYLLDCMDFAFLHASFEYLLANDNHRKENHI